VSTGVATKRDLIDAAILSGVAGWADAISYLKFHIFAGAMTGNTVLLGISVIKQSPGRAAYQLALIAVFVIFAAFTSSISKLGYRPSLLLMVESLFLVAASFGTDHWIACLMAAAMGIQTTVVPKFLGSTVNTVFITGNIGRLGEALPEIREPTARARVRLLSLTWLSYGIGAALGCAGLSLHRYVMLPPVLALCLVSAILASQPRGAPAAL
jgi:uncharacterized membrane protein YoaK (UPF0700 family)